MAWEKTAEDSTTYLSNGVVPVSGTGARTIVFRFKTSATFTTRYFWGWGTPSLGQDYRFRLEDSTGYKMRLEINGGAAVGTASGLNDGAWHCAAISNAASSDAASTTMYLDGSQDTISSSVSRTINTGTTYGLNLGVNSIGTGPAAAFAEFAIYNRALAASEMAMLTAGHITPASVPQGRILYWPLVREYVDLEGLGAITVNGSNYTISAHPRVIYPSAQILQFPPAAAGGGGPSVNINGSTVSWNGLTSYNWNGIA